MKRNINSLLGYTINGTDGEIGKVEEFYFDDRSSTIRYMVVKTGGWFSDKRVLISTDSFLKPDWKSEVFNVNLTKDKIKNSPEIDTEKPVSLHQEELMRGYYAWPGYYGNGMYGHMGMGIWGYPLVEVKATKEELEKIKNTEVNENPHLRSTQEVTGYDINATDGDIGKVQDFIVDDTTWKIHFLIVRTGNWFLEKEVLISPRWIKEVKWEEQNVTINHTKEEVKNSPKYDTSQPFDDAHEGIMNTYYGKGIYD